MKWLLGTVGKGIFWGLLHVVSGVVAIIEVFVVPLIPGTKSYTQRQAILADQREARIVFRNGYVGSVDEAREAHDKYVDNQLRELNDKT